MNVNKNADTNIFFNTNVKRCEHTDKDINATTPNTKNTTITTKNMQKNAVRYVCDSCYFICSKKSNYDNHLLTSKHINTTKYNTSDSILSKEYICDCGKLYNHRASLFNHKKKCRYFEDKNTSNSHPYAQQKNSDNQELIKLLIKENADFKNIILELVKYNATNINNTNTHTNSHNKTFNLHFFLNEQCKDAMNMSEFINSIQLKLDDLENVGKLGYVEGISNIIIKQLNDTDMHKRPLHCSDIKRETLYIKEEDKWEKEGPENTKMKKVIKTVEKKNIELITEWVDGHPRYRENTSRENDTYLKLLTETMSGDDDNVNKVIKNISKEVIIDKKE